MTVEKPEKSCNEVYREILADVAAENSTSQNLAELASSSPTFDNVRTALKRRRATVRPALPKTLEELTLSGDWTLTSSGGRFLQIDDGTHDRIPGFFSEESLQIVCDARTLLMDGTFRVVPRLFGQLYTIHAEFLGEIMPMCYFLLPNKSRETYVRLFRLMEDAAQSRGMVFLPERFQLDSEVAAIKAIEEYFPMATEKGCSFHSTRAVWRHVQKYGLACDYEKDEPVKK